SLCAVARSATAERTSRTLAVRERVIDLRATTRASGRWPPKRRLDQLCSRAMSLRALYSSDARTRVRDAIKHVEGQTSAEIVVAVRPSSGPYRHADYLAGVLMALVALCVFLYPPASFDWSFLPLELAGCFSAGALASAYAPPIRRRFTSR